MCTKGTSWTLIRQLCCGPAPVRFNEDGEEFHDPGGTYKSLYAKAFKGPQTTILFLQDFRELSQGIDNTA